MIINDTNQNNSSTFVILDPKLQRMDALQFFSVPDNNPGLLKEYFQKVTAILSNNHIGLWECDMENACMKYLNDFLHVLKLDKIGLQYDNLTKLEDYVHPEDLPKLWEVFHLARTQKGKNQTIRYRAIGPQGEVMWMEDHFYAIIEEEGDTREKIIGYTVNIEKILEEEIRANQLALLSKAMNEAQPGFIFVFDDKFFLREVFMPDSMKLLHSMKELIGMDGRHIYSPEVSELIIHNIHGCLEDGQLRELEYPVDLNNLRFYYQARIVPYKENMVLAMIQDISDRIRRIEELVEVRKQEETNKMKSTFLANMSHEIRTPLNAIVGFSEILAAEDDPENREEFISIIRKNSDLLLQIINDILDISRIESGKIEINVRETDINALIKEVAEVHQLKMKREVEFIVMMPTEPVRTYSDPNRIKQVLYNFLSNAIKHTAEGHITLRLEVEKDEIHFYVTDSGAGIPEDKMPYLFQRFEKLNSFIQGTGLGLVISKNLVEHMGGRISATSVFREGSTFTFSLPIYSSAQEATTAISNQTIANKKSNSDDSGKKRIVVLEPDDQDFNTLNDMLGSDYSLSQTRTKSETIDLYVSEKPDLFLLDISNPDNEGVETIKRIRAFSINIPIIAMATHGNYIDQEHAFKAGCNDVVLKPFTTSRLQDAIVAYI
ncbi:signal transduction histidine kinase [Parabacteroides sp. PFB2-12]|nr:signal transduction histidine kinase [Parabacteroides sp. PM6-13]MDH6390502.1 signal transduction histidine kinase [Parabacteroides sp. PFB2-12]